MSDQNDIPGSRGSRGIEMGLKILEHLAGWTNEATLARPVSASLHHFALVLVIPEPTAHRILRVLMSQGWIEKVGGEFRLAFKVALIGVGIHEGLRRQVESGAAMVQVLDQLGTATKGERSHDQC